MHLPRAIREAAAGLALLLAACQAPPPSPPRAADPDPAVLAAGQAMERGDYARAAELYRQLVATHPDSVPLHYGLAVAASYMDRREEAAREFRWVLERGAPDSAEVEAAQRWLVRVGAFRQSAGVGEGEEERQPGTAGLEGRAVYAEGGRSPEPMRRLQLFLVGQPDSPTQDERHVLRTDEDGGFRLTNLVPGPYMLTNRRAGQPIWRLRVDLQPGQDLILDLTPANSVAIRDDFPTLR